MTSEVAMQRAILYGIIAAVVVAAGVGVAFAAMSMNNTAGSAIANQQSLDNGVRVIKHEMGETEITGTPERVVVLYSIYAGDVRALGVQPVGIVDRDWINGWLTPIGYPLSEDVVNVGIPDEPNMETILQLEPDLIIGLGGKWGEKHIELYDEFSEIAPTLLFNPDPRPELDELEVAEQNFMAIADTLNRHDEGIAWLENMEARYNEASKKIEQAGYKGTNVILTTAYLQNDVPEMFIFTENAFASLLLSKMGLVTEVPDPEDTSDTWYRTGMEGLTTVDSPDVHLIVSYNAGQYDTNPLEKSPLWDNLEFVKKGQVHDIGNTRLFNQVLFAEDIANRVVKALTGSDENASKTRTISHAAGETKITGIPKRIVSLSWQSGADLLTLGVQPVGLGNADTFNEIVNLDEVILPSGVANVGAPWEPNLEAIAQLEPDLIIGSMHDNELVYDDLSEIAPTVLFHVFVQSPEQDIPNELELMKQNFITTADIVGKHDQGVTIIDRMNAKFDEARGKLANAGLQDTKFVLAYVQNDATNMWIWIDALNAQVLEEMGLENAYKSVYRDTYEFGGTAVGLEGLAIVNDPDVHFIFRQHATDTGIPDSWQDNPVWNDLEFVKVGQVYPHESLYVYAGPVAAEVLADTVVELLTSDSS